MHCHQIDFSSYPEYLYELATTQHRADKFAELCKQYRAAIMGRRLNGDRLEFVRTFVFPPSHTHLLPVRGAKKERAAYETQIEQSGGDGEEEEVDEGGTITLQNVQPETSSQS